MREASARPSWRDADLRGGEAAPSSVAAVVRHAHRGLAAVRAAEAALVGVSGAGIALAAAVLSGAPLGARGAWAAAGVAGAFAAAAWWLDSRASELDVARALDERLRHGGALLTAWEVERRGGRSPLAALVRARVLRRLRRGEALRAVLPPLAPPVLAPVIAAALLVLALERVREESAPPPLAPATGAVVDALEAVAARGFDSLDEVAATAEARAAARALDRELEELAARDPAAARRRIDALDRDLARLAVGADPASALARDVARARSWLDAARQGLPASPKREPGAADGGDAPAAAAAEGGPGEAAAGAGEAGSAPADDEGAAVTAAPPAGGAPAPSAPASGAEAGAIERGTTAGTWWPDRHDEVVRRWIEARRRDLGPGR